MPHDDTLNPVDILKAIDITRITAIMPLQGGSDTTLWRVTHDSVSSVLRVFRPEQASTYLREVEAVTTPLRKRSGFSEQAPGSVAPLPQF